MIKKPSFKGFFSASMFMLRGNQKGRRAMFNLLKKLFGMGSQITPKFISKEPTSLEEYEGLVNCLGLEGEDVHPGLSQ